MSDRVMIMCEGRLSGILEKDEVSQEEVMKFATRFSNKAKEVVS